MKKLNVSGYRGIWGEDLNEQISFEFGLAFAQMIKEKKLPQKILIGRDARNTGEKILTAFISALKIENIEHEYAGIIPTPSVLLAVNEGSFGGGLIITASHNPKEYNGLKFVNSKGLFLKEEEINKINTNREQIINQNITYTTDATLPLNKGNNTYTEKHIQKILENINTEIIKNKKYKIAHDPINSAGSIITKKLLESLGCEVLQINSETNGEFAHSPEPTKENLTQLSEFVKKTKADIGFAQDPDADRLVLVDEKGEIINEEYTLSLCIENILAQSPKGADVVLNLSTSNTSLEIGEKHGAKIHHTKIGEANVVNKIIETNAIIGGEGSGGVIYPKINTARDSLVGIALILELMASREQKISELVSKLPYFYNKKEKYQIKENSQNILKIAESIFPEAHKNSLDGIRFDFTDKSWIHIRRSNTEPLIRIIGESKDPKKLEELFNKIRLTLELQ